MRPGALRQTPPLHVFGSWRRRVLAMSYNGFYKRRRGILEHLEAGAVSILETDSHDLLCLKANPFVGGVSHCPPEIYIGSARAIRACCPNGISERSIQRSLEKLEKLAWIKRWTTKGRRGNYPILVVRFVVTESSGK